MDRDIVRPSRRLEEGARERRFHNTNVNIYEYNWHANGNWMNWATVPEDSDANDVFREKGLNPRFVGMYTIINCTEWEDKQGKKHNFELQFLPAKEKTVELVRERKLSKDGLAGKMVKVKRFEGSKTLSAGDDYDVEKEVEMDKVVGYALFRGDKFLDLLNQANEDPARMVFMQSKFQLEMAENKALSKLVPFNYLELLKPPNVREARSLMAGVTKNTGRQGAGGTTENSEDDMPF